MNSPIEPEHAEDPRVRFAGERTLLAWVRTGLAMMGFGFVVARFGMYLREMAILRGLEVPARNSYSVWMGLALILLGVAASLVAAIEHARFLRRIQRGEPYHPPAVSLGIIVTVILAIIGIAMAAYLFQNR